MAENKEKEPAPTDLKYFLTEIQEMTTHNNKENIMKSDSQLDRLFSQKFQNPYDVLLLKPEAPDEEIKKQYRSISVLIHPDKCKDPRAYEAFHMVEQAYKTLMDSEKRKVYQRIMREARERVDYERKKENKRREKMGMPLLPFDTLEAEYKETCKKLFDEIEERRNHFIKLEESQKQKKRDELEEKKMKEQIRQMTEEEWEKTRDERVSNWRNFASKKTVIGTKKSNKQIRAPQVRVEERPASAAKLEPSGKPMEIIDDLTTLLPKLRKLSALLKTSKNPLIFTGAGISTSSGIPDYRSSFKTLLKTGPGVYESPENRLKFKGTPVIRPAIEAQPSLTHMTIKTLIDKQLISHIITQNVDNLHLRSGVPEEKLTELHGNICKEFCEKCHKVFYRDFYVRPPNFTDSSEIYTARHCSSCGSRLRKTVVNFGEKVWEEKLKKSYEVIRSSDFCLCLGTSFRVNPASRIPREFVKEKGKKMAIVNLQRTFSEEKAELVLHGFCDAIMEAFMNELSIKIEQFNIRKSFALEFCRGEEGFKVKCEGKTVGKIKESFDNIQEIEIFDMEKRIFFRKKAEEGRLGIISLEKNVTNLKICLKFYGNLMEPNFNLSFNLEELLKNNDSVRFDYEIVLDEFVREWTVQKVSKYKFTFVK